MGYSDITTNDPNLIKRWLQKKRILDAISAIQFLNSDGVRLNILDYGAGDGQLVFHAMEELGIVDQATVYEPTPSLMNEAREKLSGFDCVNFSDNTSSIDDNSFDIIFCLEVFEHLPGKERWGAINDIHRLLKPSGVAVIGVPHEIFLPALFKGMFRMTRRYGAFDASIKNIMLAMLGCPPKDRPVGEIYPGFCYYFEHLGFDFRELEVDLRSRFFVRKKWYSPFSWFGSVINSEVYFLLGK